MGVSRRSYAKHRSLSEGAIRKALASGRISLEADGTIDIVKADAAWARNRTPTVGEPHPAGAPAPEAKTPVSKEAVAVVAKTLTDAGQPELLVEGGMTFTAARTANEILKAQERELKLEKLRGSLVDKTKATEKVFAAARQERDAWLQWPARISALMAADLKSDAHTVQQALETYVRRQLGELADFAVELR